MERRGGRGGPSRGGSRGRGGSFGDRGGGSSRGRGFSRGGRGGGGRSESRFSRDDRPDRPPFDSRGGGRGGGGGPRGRGSGFNRDFRGGRSGDRDFHGGRMERGGRGGGIGKRPASGPPQAGKRPRYEGGSSYPNANGYTAPYQSYERNPASQSSYQTQPPYRSGGGSGYGGAETSGYVSSSGGYSSAGYMAPSGYDSADGGYGGYSAPPPTSDHYGDSYKSKHYEGSSSGYGQSREYSSQPRSRY